MALIPDATAVSDPQIRLLAGVPMAGPIQPSGLSSQHLPRCRGAEPQRPQPRQHCDKVGQRATIVEALKRRQWILPLAVPRSMIKTKPAEGP